MPTPRYDHLQILRLNMATQMLLTEALGKYLAYPRRIDAIADEIGRALVQISEIADPGVMQCSPPFCDNGDGKCVPCRIDDPGVGYASGVSARVAKPGHGHRKAYARAGNGKAKRSPGRSETGSQPRRRA